MRRLYQLILKWHAFLIFLALQTVSFFLLVRSNSYHYSSFFSSSNEIAGNLLETRNNISEYFRYGEINDDLASELSEYKNKEERSYIRVGNSDFYEYNDTIFLQKWQYAPAHVINKSVNRVNNSLTLDKGLRHDVSEDMGVVFNNKIVGITKNVSDNFAVVMPVINENFRTSVKHKNSGDFGMLENWSGLNPQEGKVFGIPKTANIEIGDSILTSGYSIYFPENMEVGIVQEIEVSDGGESYILTIDLSTDFYSLSNVQLITNITKEEQETLEEEFVNGS